MKLNLYFLLHIVCRLLQIKEIYPLPYLGGTKSCVPLKRYGSSKNIEVKGFHMCLVSKLDEIISKCCSFIALPRRRNLCLDTPLILPSCLRNADLESR